MPDVKPVPEGQPTVTPYLIVPDARRQIEFLVEAFGAVEDGRTAAADGRVMHAQVSLGDSKVMMGEATSDWEPMPSSIHLYVEDCDATYRRALDAGATVVMEVDDRFYGDRQGGVRDPNGNVWWISTHVEDVSEEEMARRMKEMDAGS